MKWLISHDLCRLQELQLIISAGLFLLNNVLLTDKDTSKEVNYFPAIAYRTKAVNRASSSPSSRLLKLIMKINYDSAYLIRLSRVSVELMTLRTYPVPGTKQIPKHLSLIYHISFVTSGQSFCQLIFLLLRYY